MNSDTQYLAESQSLLQNNSHDHHRDHQAVANFLRHAGRRNRNLAWPTFRESRNPHECDPRRREFSLQASRQADFQQLSHAPDAVISDACAHTSTVQLVIPVAGVAVVGLFWTISLRNKGLDNSDPSTSFLKRSYRMALISYIVLVILAYFLRNSAELALYLMLSPVLMLVISSVRNSWGLMMMIRTKEDDLK